MNEASHRLNAVRDRIARAQRQEARDPIAPALQADDHRHQHDCQDEAGQQEGADLRSIEVAEAPEARRQRQREDDEQVGDALDEDGAHATADRGAEVALEQVGACQVSRCIANQPGGTMLLCEAESRLKILDGGIRLQHQKIDVAQCIIGSDDSLRVLDLHGNLKHGLCV